VTFGQDSTKVQERESAAGRQVVTNPIGTAFDIRFRVVTTEGVPVLTSDCYQYYVR
jgi:hypothetical protein